MLELLEQLFRHVRAYAQSKRFNRDQVYFQSPEHTTMQFDRDAEDIIIQGLKESGIGFEVIAEESPIFSTALSPQYRIVVDPIDGSDNVKRGIMSAGVALAVLPIDVPVLPEQVQWALVGELFSGTVYEAKRGGGAFRNGRRCQVSTTKHISECVAGFNMDGRDPKAISAILLEEPIPLQVRRIGTAAVDSVYVASGAYDAYIDIGEKLTAESFLASACIILEAGGIVTDQKGQPLPPITDALNDGYSVVMAGTRELHQEILARLKS